MRTMGTGWLQGCRRDDMAEGKCEQWMFRRRDHSRGRLKKDGSDDDQQLQVVMVVVVIVVVVVVVVVAVELIGSTFQGESSRKMGQTTINKFS